MNQQSVRSKYPGMSHSDRKKITDNEERISGINKSLIIMVVFLLAAMLIPIIISSLTDLDIAVYVLVICLLGAGVASYFCAIFAGYRSVVDEKNVFGGQGCAGLLLSPITVPIYCIGIIYFVFTGWAYGLSAKNKLLEENNRIIEEHDTKPKSKDTDAQNTRGIVTIEFGFIVSGTIQVWNMDNREILWEGKYNRRGAVFEIDGETEIGITYNLCCKPTKKRRACAHAGDHYSLNWVEGPWGPDTVLEFVK